MGSDSAFGEPFYLNGKTNNNINAQKEALWKIRTAGNNANSTARWMQKWVAYGLEPNKRERPSDKPPNKDVIYNIEQFIDVINAVYSIQCDIYDLTETEYFNIIVGSNGFAITVEFMGIQIWNSEDDDREYDETKDDYEPIEQYLRRIIKEEIDKMSKIIL